MVFSGSMRASGMSDRAKQLVQAMVIDKAFVRPLDAPERTVVGTPTSLTAPAFHQPYQPMVHIAVDLVELIRRIACPEVSTPTS